MYLMIYLLHIITVYPETVFNLESKDFSMLNFYRIWIKIHETCTKNHIHIKGIDEQMTKNVHVFWAYPNQYIEFWDNPTTGKAF